MPSWDATEPNTGTHTTSTSTSVRIGTDVEKQMFCARRRGFLHHLCARYKSLLFLTFLVFVFFHSGFYAGQTAHSNLKVSPVANKFDGLTRAASDILRGSKGGTILTQHPIPKLMDDAEDKYRIKLKRQSKTLRAAVAEYKKRYKRHPPKGFDEWWAFAKENDVKMVDEFDGLVRDLEPFWRLSGEEIRRRTLQAGELPSIHLVRIRDGESSTVKMNHAYEDSEVSARALGFRDMIANFESKLPDMDFSINAKAEGRVLVSWDHLTYPNTTTQDSSKGIESVLGGPFVPDWGDDGNIWETWRRTCPLDTPARRLFASVRNPFANSATNYFSTDGAPKSSNSGPSNFNFISTTSTNIVDFCKRPHLHTSQGHFFSDWRTLPALYPVFTPAKAQGFMDIKIPSHYYYGSTQRYTYGWDPVNLELKDVDPMEVPWEDKLDKVFWRGATTGGGSHPPGFAPQYQRHRFLRMTSSSSEVSSNRTTSITFADPPNSDRYITTRTVPTSELNDEVMDVAFVKAVATASYPGGETALKKDHRFSDAVPLGEHWKYRYLVDLDGMSYSGRFFAFLASDSVPIKATVYEEWFSDWIQPWVHFIPLSVTYKEIYNILAYFSGPTPSVLKSVNETLSSSSSSGVLSNYAIEALQDQKVLQSTKEGREKLRSVDAERRLKRIARAGKEWKRTMGRQVDMEVYVYRLCLEWARLWADDRDSMAFKL